MANWTGTQSLLVVTYANGQTAYLSTKEPVVERKDRESAVADGQRKGLIPMGHITTILRAH
jgi:hypothetical protein